MPRVKGGPRRWLGMSLLAVVSGLLGSLILQSQVALLTTRGISMKPHFQTGDLAVTTVASSYRVGDIVAYHSKPSNAIVLHRIIAERDGVYTFKGDNNSWTDLARPTRKDLVGKLWFRIPHAGMIAEYTGAPGHTLLLIGGVVLLLAGGATQQTRRRRRRRGASPDDPGSRRTEPPRPRPRARPPGIPADLVDAVNDLAFPALCFLVTLLLVGVTLSRPTTRSTTEKRTLTQQVTYGYTGTAPTGTTYPDGSVRTGSPIFLRLVQQIDFQIGYRMDAEDAVHNAAGAYSIDAVLSGVGSWQRTIELQPRTTFSGPGFSTQVTLDVPQIQAIVAATQAETGVKGGDVLVDIVPRVTTNAFAGDVPVSGVFDQSLRLKMTPLDITPVKAPGDKTDGLTESEKSDYRSPVQRVRKVEFVGRSMDVSTARLITIVLFVGALGWFGAAVVAFEQLRRKPAAERLTHRYQSSIIDVSSPPQVADPVDVADMAALAKIAEQTERLILHHGDGGVHTFVVEDDVTTYRFRLVDPAPLEEMASPPPPADTAHTMPSPPPYAPPSPVVDRHDHPMPVAAPVTVPVAAPDAVPDAVPAAAPAVASEQMPPVDGGNVADAAFQALLAIGGFFETVTPSAPEVTETAPAIEPVAPPPYLGAPPPYEPPPPDADASTNVLVASLDAALRLSPLSEAEQAEFGVGTDPSDHAETGETL